MTFGMAEIFKRLWNRVWTFQFPCRILFINFSSSNRTPVFISILISKIEIVFEEDARLYIHLSTRYHLTPPLNAFRPSSPNHLHWTFLATRDCIREVSDTLHVGYTMLAIPYHSRHYCRDREYECDNGLRVANSLSTVLRNERQT